MGYFGRYSGRHMRFPGDEDPEWVTILGWVFWALVIFGALRYWL